MIINLMLFVLGLYSLGSGISFLLFQDKNRQLDKHLWVILIGLVFLITSASILDVAKISMDTFMLAKTSLSGIQFIFILSSIPVIYWLLSFLKKKQKLNIVQLVPLTLFASMFIFIFLKPNYQISSPTITNQIKKSLSTSPEYAKVATEYIAEFYLTLSGSKSGVLLTSPIGERLIFTTLIILGIKIVRLKSRSSIKELLLGSVILSMSLFYPTKAIYILCSWALLALIYLFLKNSKQSFLILKSILIALVLNPLMWSLML